MPLLSKEELEVIIEHIEVLTEESIELRVKLFYNLLKNKKTLEYFAFLRAADYLGMECILQHLGAILEVSFEFLSERCPEFIQTQSEFAQDYTDFLAIEKEAFKHQFLCGLLDLEFM